MTYHSLHKFGHRLFLAYVLLCSAVGYAQETVRMRDVLASAPDSIFPLLTRNNRLDCIDFAENNMAAKVKNRVDETSELKVLTEHYLLFQISPVSRVEMMMLNDSIFCMVNTYSGPAEDSHVSFYDTSWKAVALPVPAPKTEEFWTAVTDSMAEKVESVWQLLADMRLVSVGLNAEERTLTLTLQTSFLPTKERETVQSYVQPLVYQWNGKEFHRR